tara:strand:+ start:1030 stop:1377 length:348 start_codon:yes stop_codon:yes gene_type:complete
MTKPANKELYERIKKQLYKEIPQHSAYRSGLLVQRYKEAGGTYEGTKPKKKGLARWFKEEWKNQRGGTGYQKKGDVYRPTKRITSKTPKTFDELSKSEIAKAQKAKKDKGRAVFK